MVNLTYDFRLQFEDPEFDNALTNLSNIADLPSKATVKVVKLVDLDLSSNSTDDTIITNLSSPDHSNGWPEEFNIPNFSYEVEFALREGNLKYEKTGDLLKLNWEQKHNILTVMASEIYSYKAYPNFRELGTAAEALVTKHPCLRETGSNSGYGGWTNSLRFKMGNLRTKLSKAGIKDVAVNSGKRSRSNPEASPSRANIKRPRRGEVNFLPNLPQGHTEESLEAQRLAMVEECKKTDRDMSLINRSMQSTFALRRDEMVKTEPPIADLKERWPALFTEAQVSQILLLLPHLSVKGVLHRFATSSLLLQNR